jgi:hypothetical protein
LSLTGDKIGRPEDNKAAFKEGWINGYRVFFQEKLNINWVEAPANLGILEEIVLTRNRAQHPETITSLKIKQSERHATKYRRSFFADEFELKMLDHAPWAESMLGPWELHITQEKVSAALDEVERFCVWLEEQLKKWPGQLNENVKL